MSHTLAFANCYEKSWARFYLATFI